MDRGLPSCCGSEDGELVYGVDSARESTTMIEAWVCQTCGVITVTHVVQMSNR